MAEVGWVNDAPWSLACIPDHHQMEEKTAACYAHIPEEKNFLETLRSYLMGDFKLGVWEEKQGSSQLTIAWCSLHSNWVLLGMLINLWMLKFPTYLI